MSESPGTKARLDKLAALALERDRIESEIRDAVIAARADNRKGGRWASWHQIGAMLGRSSSAVQKRYAEFVPRERVRIDRRARIECPTCHERIGVLADDGPETPEVQAQRALYEHMDERHI